MICGFLHRENEKIVNGQGEEVILKGWGLGNWLLPEGYMWNCYNPRFDRPRRIEQVIEELTGKAFAQWFWEEFRANYIRREDIEAIQRLGYNSVRIPFNYRLFMVDGPGICWKEEGFALLDQCLDWCEAQGLYAFLDLHGAPGGQTGSNIDDSMDNVPRLFMDAHCQEMAIALWVELARRYRNRVVVGGYDLLNEPIIPANGGNGDFDTFIPHLKQFYKKVIQAIRCVDPNHLLSVEGPHWATDVCIFDEVYDENMVLHFHRYAQPPEISCLEPYIHARHRQMLPLWMGETGENINTWYAALYPLAESLGIGYNLWPWKKMDCTNSPCSVKIPEGWDKILTYIEGGPHPGHAQAGRILCEYLENIRYENCIHNKAVTRHVLRRPPFCVQAVDFDCVEGERRLEEKAPLQKADDRGDFSYRVRSGMDILAITKNTEKKFVFDCGWERFILVLHPHQQISYTFDTFGMPGKVVNIMIEYEAVQKVCLLAGLSVCGGSDDLFTNVNLCDEDACLAAGIEVYSREICMSCGWKRETLTMTAEPDSGKRQLWLQVVGGDIRLKTISWSYEQVCVG